MRIIKKLTFEFGLIGFISIFTTSSVFATGATVTIASATSATRVIPTLSGTMLIVLSLLLLVFSFRVAKQNNGNVGKFFMVLICVAAIAAGGRGFKLVTEATAGGSITVPLMPGTQSYRLLSNLTDPNSGFFGSISNNSGQAITILSITPDATSSCSFPGAGNACSGSTIPLASSLTFPNGQSCLVDCGVTIAISDRRLKRNINFLSELENGIKLYSFKYIAGYYPNDITYVGVLAQDLLNNPIYKQSVHLMENNYYRVDYQSLNLRMITLDQWLQSPDSIFSKVKS